MGAWLHPGLSSERLENLRFWALRAAGQSREGGEPEDVWAGYLATAALASDLLDQREHGCRSSRFAGCAVLKMRSTEDERNKRNGCFYPLCLIPVNRNMQGRVQFHHND